MVALILLELRVNLLVDLIYFFLFGAFSLLLAFVTEGTQTILPYLGGASFKHSEIGFKHTFATAPSTLLREFEDESIIDFIPLLVSANQPLIVRV